MIVIDQIITDHNTIQSCACTKKMSIQGNLPPENALVHSAVRGERSNVIVIYQIITIKLNPMHAQNVHSMATYPLRMHLFTVQQVEKGQM